MIKFSKYSSLNIIKRNPVRNKVERNLVFDKSFLNIIKSTHHPTYKKLIYVRQIMLQLFRPILLQKIKPFPYKILLKFKMNKPQKQIIFIELVIVGLVVWRYLENNLTFNSTLTYTLLYAICMSGWFYFRGK